VDGRDDAHRDEYAYDAGRTRVTTPASTTGRPRLSAALVSERRNGGTMGRTATMNRQHPLALVAGAATLLAAMPLTTVFASYTWLFHTTVAVALMVGAAMGVRALRGPVWVQVFSMAATLLLYLTWNFPSHQEFGPFPTTATFRHFAQLFADSSAQIRDEAVPVGDFDGLLLLTIAGVGLVAIAVDFLAVGIRRPALAGLPMLAIYSVPVAVMPDGLSIFPFGFAAAGYLWLLMTDSVDRVRRFGRRFTGDGRDVDVWEPSPLSAAGRRLGMAGVVIAILLPLAVPGMTSGLLDRFGTGFGPGAGEGSLDGSTGAVVDMRALLVDNLRRDDPFDMVEVTTDDPSPALLRFGVADQATTKGFDPRTPAGGQRLAEALDGYQPPDRTGVSARRYQAQVRSLRFDQALAPYYPQLVSLAGLDNAWRLDQPTGQVYSSRAKLSEREYTFVYEEVAYTPNALRAAGPIPPQDGVRQYAQIEQIDQITALVTQLIAGEATQYDQVRALHDYFSSDNDFVYSFEAPPGDSGHAIVDFLNNKQGFCEQYAAALAWLVRAASIPARVAYGFTAGQNADGDNTRLLSTANLHAWTEVYFNGFGWVPFDATPSTSITGAVRMPWAPEPGDPEFGGEDEPTPGDSASPGAGPTGPVGPNRDPNAGEQIGPTTRDMSGWWIGGAAAAALMLVLLFAPSVRRRALRRARLARSGAMVVLDAGGPRTAAPDPFGLVTEDIGVRDAQRDAHLAWAELLDTMIDYGVPIDESETPRATGERVGALPGLIAGTAGHVDLLARAEERARYARTPLRPDGLDEAVGAARAALHDRATRWEQIRATFMPMSVLMRWRLAWIGWVNRSIGLAARGRAMMAYVSPRRLLTR
jgi:transglutaminase-like putative cysteine protease